MVGDEHVCQLPFLLKILHQIQDLGLNRHIQCRNRLIAHNKLRLEHECTANANTLSAASVQLVRIGVFQSAGKPHRVHDLPYPFLIVSAVVHQFVHQKRLTDDLTDRLSGVNGRERILKDDLHLPSQLMQTLGAYVRNILSVEADRTGGALQQVKDHPAQRRFTAARLTHYAQRSTTRNVEGYAVHSMQFTVFSRKIFFQIPH